MIISLDRLFLNRSDGVFDASMIRSGLNFLEMVSIVLLIILSNCFFDFFPY